VAVLPTETCSSVAIGTRAVAMMELLIGLRLGAHVERGREGPGEGLAREASRAGHGLGGGGPHMRRPPGRLVGEALQQLDGLLHVLALVRGDELVDGPRQEGGAAREQLVDQFGRGRVGAHQLLAAVLRVGLAVDQPGGLEHRQALRDGLRADVLQRGQPRRGDGPSRTTLASTPSCVRVRPVACCPDSVRSRARSRVIASLSRCAVATDCCGPGFVFMVQRKTTQVTLPSYLCSFPPVSVDRAQTEPPPGSSRRASPRGAALSRTTSAMSASFRPLGWEAGTARVWLSEVMARTR
jgi:hypothetical protein